MAKRVVHRAEAPQESKEPQQQVEQAPAQTQVVQPPAARDLASVLEDLSSQDGREDDDVLPDLEPMVGTPIVPKIEPKAETAVPAVLARELSGFKKMIGPAQKLIIYRQTETGRMALIDEYSPHDIEPYGSVALFVRKVLAPRHGGGGTFEIVGRSANGKEFRLEPVVIDRPEARPAGEVEGEMTRDLLQQLKMANEKLLEVKTAPPPDPVEQFERLEQLKQRMSTGGGATDALLLMMLQNQNRGPDPAVVQLSGLVERMVDKVAALERVVSAPPPPPPPPPPPGPDPTVMAIELAKLLRPEPRDDLKTLASLREVMRPSDDQITVKDLLTQVLPVLTNTAKEQSPFRERLEELALLKKLFGNDNPFVDVIKTFVTSPLGANLGEGIGMAVRESAKQRQLPAETSKQEQKIEEPKIPDFPPGYLSTYQKRLEDAKDDADRIHAVIDSLLGLASHPEWAKFASAVLEATCLDDNPAVQQMLMALFNFWGRRGATIGREHVDAALKAVNLNWDLIVESVCVHLKKPVPDAVKARRNQQAAPTNGTGEKDAAVVPQAVIPPPADKVVS